MARYEVQYRHGKTGKPAVRRVVAMDEPDARAWADEHRPRGHELAAVTRLPDAEPYKQKRRRKAEADA
jgi:hypothetical protein